MILNRRRGSVLAAGLLAGGLALTAVPTTLAGAAGGNFGDKPTRASGKNSSGSTLSIRSSQVGAVQVSPKVYLVEWGSQWTKDTTGAVAALQGLFSGLYGGGESWGPILDQYCQGIAAGTSNCSGATHINPSNVFGQVVQDMRTAAPTKATTAQLAAEALKAAGITGDYSVNAQYVIMSPSGTHPGGFSGSNFCGWHSSTPIPGGGNLSYTNLPFVPDLGVGACTTLSPAQQLDGYESTETHEFAESVTDPFPSTGWLAKNGEEIADLCINWDTRESYGGASYDMQGLWSNQAGKCVTSVTPTS